eukprot:834314-Lingulodinium_polyedra.AAC.1
MDNEREQQHAVERDVPGGPREAEEGDARLLPRDVSLLPPLAAQQKAPPVGLQHLVRQRRDHHLL